MRLTVQHNFLLYSWEYILGLLFVSSTILNTACSFLNTFNKSGFFKGHWLEQTTVWFTFLQNNCYIPQTVWSLICWPHPVENLSQTFEIGFSMYWVSLAFRISYVSGACVPLIFINSGIVFWYFVAFISWTVLLFSIPSGLTGDFVKGFSCFVYPPPE